MAGGLVSVGLPRDAQLVELSAAITFPGALAQELHTDISPGLAAGEPAPLVTAWLAMRSIQDLGQGPTMVIPGSHLRYARRAERMQQGVQEDAELEQRTVEPMWDPDLREVAQDKIRQERLRLNKAAGVVDDAREEQEFGPLPAPRALLLEAGSMGIMDCRIAHFGSGVDARSASGQPQETRMLLNATFASSAALKVNGFTYHRLQDMPQVTLGSILDG